MRKIISGLVSILIAGIAFSTVAHAGNEAQAHIGHVMNSWNDTPSEQGLLPTAMKEASIAAAHADYAAKATDNLDEMKLHASHVRHSIDTALEAGGPGIGYGLLKAADGASGHITFASKSSDASEAVKTHTVHVVSSLNNAIARSRLVLVEAQAIYDATTASEAAPHAVKMAELTQASIVGVDANGDGKISWHEGEGGLNTADQHMAFILDAEGMKR
ncbi:MAG: hypothetical protein ACJAS1_004176 [Oleiphilaceae bacterium]|jgi:hypothetical protein